MKSYGQVLLILFIFSITGFSTLYVKQLFYLLFGVTEQTAGWIKVSLWLGMVLPAYQVLFLFYGFIFGQFDFVWKFEKKSFGRLKSLFVRSDQA